MPVLRRARASDAAALSALALISKAHWGYDEAFMQACHDELTYTAAIFTSSNREFWLVEDALLNQCDEANQPQCIVCGFIALRCDGDSSEGVRFEGETAEGKSSEGKTAEIEALFIHPNHMRTGLATSLLDKAFESAQKRDVQVLMVQSDPHAEPFYQSRGFETISRVPSGSIKGRTLPLMKRAV